MRDPAVLSPYVRLSGLLGGTEGVIDLASGSPNWSLPAGCQALLAGSEAWNLEVSPRGLPVFHAAIDRWIERTFRADGAPWTKLPTAGSKEGLASVAIWALAKGREQGRSTILVPAGSYHAFHATAVALGARVRVVEARQGERFSDALARLPQQARDESALLYFPFPPSPFAPSEDLDSLAATLKMARQSGVILLADECMLELASPSRPPGFLDLVARTDRFPDTLVVSTSLSKRSFASALRAGCLITSGAAGQELRSLRGFLSPVVQAPLQAAAAALWDDVSRADDVRAHLALARRELSRVIPEAIIPDCGLYGWIPVADDMAAARAIHEAGVRVMPATLLCSGMAPATWPNALRLALHGNLDLLRAGLEALPIGLA